MVTVRTTCSNCNGLGVDIESEGILLLLQEDAEEGSYAFQCPECLTVQDKPADQRLAMLLIAADVPWTR